MYPFMTLPVHFHTVFLITVKIYPSTFLMFYMSTDVPVHHCNCAVYFLFFGITCTTTFQFGYWGTYTQIHPRLNLPVYLHASLPSNHKDLPVSTTTCVPAHRCTRSLPSVFIFILFLITVKIYPSTFLLFYMFTHVHHYNCSVFFFFFGITCTMSFWFVCWGTYRHIHPKRNVPVYPHAFLWSNNKYLPVSTTTSVPAHRCTRSWPYLFIVIQFFWYPLSSTRPRFCCSTFTQTYLFIKIPVQFISHFSAYPTQIPFNSSTGVPTHWSTRK